MNTASTQDIVPLTTTPGMQSKIAPTTMAPTNSSMILWTGVTSVTSIGRASWIKLRGLVMGGQAPAIFTGDLH
jgi:hypothetical protein